MQYIPIVSSEQADISICDMKPLLSGPFLKRNRLENTSSERIQSCYRSYLVRRRLHEVWRGILEQQLAEIKKLPEGDDSLVKKLTATVGRAAAMFQGGGLKKAGGDKILVGWNYDFQRRISF